MRKYLSERNLVIVLFITAFVVFALAQEDARKVQKLYEQTGASAFFPHSSMGQRAQNDLK